MTSRAIPAPSLLVVAVGAAARDSKVYAYTSKFVSCCFLIPALETAVVDIFFFIQQTVCFIDRIIPFMQLYKLCIDFFFFQSETRC